MLTPLVIAMPRPMAEALGWPDEPLGFADLATLAENAEGWAAVGHPEWGPFRLGKTNPNYSTSGLNFTVAEYYAATGKRAGLTTEDLARPAAVEFATQIESAVVHYGDITMTFLNNWFAADLRDTALTYASAVAVEEKSVIDYNLGNPDGVLSPGEEARVPRVPLVAIYPEEGTLFSDNPFIVLDTEWVDEDEKAAAALFEEYVQQPENQAKVLEFGFRPNNPAVALAEPIVAANGVDPAQPTTELEVPAPEVLVGILDSWAELRKDARVLLVLDISGSMGDLAGDGKTKLDLAKEAAVSSLDQFKDADEVGLWVFSTDLGGPDPNVLDLVPIASIGSQRDELAQQIENQRPTNGTPLYAVTEQAYETMLEGYDPTKINAIVLLTDGQNDDGEPGDDEDQFAELIQSLQAGSEGSSAQPVRLFTISYGEEADVVTLRAVAQATRAATYNASNPATIEQVFTAVISNF
jgi:Ca-activated chloride channel family protein